MFHYKIVRQKALWASCIKITTFNSQKLQLNNMASLEDISLLSPDNIVITKEHLKTCCKPVYHPRRFKSKGALLIPVFQYGTSPLDMSPRTIFIREFCPPGHYSLVDFVPLGHYSLVHITSQTLKTSDGVGTIKVESHRTNFEYNTSRYSGLVRIVVRVDRISEVQCLYLLNAIEVQQLL